MAFSNIRHSVCGSQEVSNTLAVYERSGNRDY